MTPETGARHERRYHAYLSLTRHTRAHKGEVARALGISVNSARRYERAARAAAELPARPQHEPAPPILPGAWVSEAACAHPDYDPAWWMPDELRGRTRRRAEARARQICRMCPVARACLAHALAVPEIHGVWGGVDPVARALMLSDNESTEHAEGDAAA